MTTIRFEQDGAIGSMVLVNPPFNRIDSAFAIDLRDALHNASESKIRVLVVRAEGPNFSVGADVHEWPGKDANWFRTYIAELTQSYRAIEALQVPTLAAVQGLAQGGGFELALACDLIVAAENAAFRNPEVTTVMFPIAGGMQRIADRIGRARAARMAMFGDSISASDAFKSGFVSHLVSTDRLRQEADALARKMATGPTLAYGAMRAMLKAWSDGGVATADAVMLDLTMDLFNSKDATKGFAATAKAIEANVQRPTLTFEGQ
ncbi:MAG TPA: enoyl-CoA hydratase/isomerase family protein [Xanthobacteraceae bacterium]